MIIIVNGRQNLKLHSNDCFEQFHQSAIEQRDKAVLENEGSFPESEEDLLYKQVFFISYK